MAKSNLVPVDAPTTTPIAPGFTMTFLQDVEYTTECRAEPTAAKYGPPPHYHLTYDEIFIVLEGSIDFMVDHVWKRVTPQDGQLIVPKGVVHAFSTIPGQTSVFREGTKPKGESKILFFRNLFADGAVSSNPLKLFPVFAESYGDTYPYIGGIKFLEKGVLRIGSGLGRLLGFSPKYSGFAQAE